MAGSVFSDDSQEDQKRASDIGYAVDVKFLDLEGAANWRTNDIVSLQIIRNTLEKLSSVTVLTLPLELIAEQTLELMLKQKKFPRVSIEYQQVDPNKPIAAFSRTYTPLNTFHFKKYRCVQIKQLEQPLAGARNIMVHLMLVNELAFYLNNSHRYNKIFFDKTLQYILYHIDKKDTVAGGGYQGFLRKFGVNSKKQNSIWLRALIPNEFVNQHIFEQVMVKTHNDLHVVKYLMDTYKYTTYPSTVFFDDFYLPTPNREIELMALMTIHTSHPFNMNQYVMFDIRKPFFAEALDSLRMLNNTSINDHNESINYKEKLDPNGDDFGQENNILINTAGDYMHISKKLDVKFNIPQSMQNKATGYEKKDELLYSTFKDSPTFDLSTMEHLQSNQSIRTFAIDNHDAQKQRMINCQHLLNKEIEGFYTFESNRIHFDAMQFERRYNFDSFSPESFSFVPVIIVNTFTRKENKNTLLRHSCRFQCIRYADIPEEKYDMRITAGEDTLKIMEAVANFDPSNPLGMFDVMDNIINKVNSVINLGGVVNDLMDKLKDFAGSALGDLAELAGLNSIMSDIGLTNAIGNIQNVIPNFNIQGFVQDISNNQVANIIPDFSFDNILSTMGGNMDLARQAKELLDNSTLSNAGKGLVLKALQNPTGLNINSIIGQVSTLEYNVTRAMSEVTKLQNAPSGMLDDVTIPISQIVAGLFTEIPNTTNNINNQNKQNTTNVFNQDVLITTSRDISIGEILTIGAYAPLPNGSVIKWNIWLDDTNVEFAVKPVGLSSTVNNGYTSIGIDTSISNVGDLANVAAVPYTVMIYVDDIPNYHSSYLINPHYQPISTVSGHTRINTSLRRVNNEESKAILTNITNITTPIMYKISDLGAYIYREKLATVDSTKLKLLDELYDYWRSNLSSAGRVPNELSDIELETDIWKATSDSLRTDLILFINAKNYVDGLTGIDGVSSRMGGIIRELELAIGVVDVAYDAVAEPDLVTNRPTFTNPILINGADPWVMLHNDGYYYCMVTLSDKLQIMKSRSFTNLTNVEVKDIWFPPASGANSTYIWAPEIHHISGVWYVYYTASDISNKDDDSSRHTFVLKNSSSDPMLGAWEDLGMINTLYPGIDAHTFTHNGQLYFLYSPYVNNQSAIAIAKMTTPWQINSEIVLSSPMYPWESTGDRMIMEGPQFISGPGDKVFIIYSAGAFWDDDYGLGWLWAYKGSNLLDPSSWTRSTQQVFSYDPNNSAYSIGHGSFTISPDGTEYWNIYHGFELQYPQTHYRGTRAQQFHWDAQGYPIFGQPVPLGVPYDQPSGVLD